MTPPSRRWNHPCIPWDTEGRHCVLGLLLGAACCPDGRCALCRRDWARRRSLGFSEAEVARRTARERARLRPTCPRCGCPPPPPLQEIPPLPRFDREGREKSGAPACRICGGFLAAGQRFYCGDECRLEHRRRTEGWGESGRRASPASRPPKRVTGLRAASLVEDELPDLSGGTNDAPFGQRFLPRSAETRRPG